MILDAYLLVIAFSAFFLLSVCFYTFLKERQILSTLSLISFGIAIKTVMNSYGIQDDDLRLNVILEVLGNVGIVMIVLEAALDLKIEREKTGLIVRSLAIAVVGMAAAIFGLAQFFVYIFPSASYFQAIMYAIPLSIMSSAIIIPSVGRLSGRKREFMVYESTFSDIVGIMVFYFMIGADGSSGSGNILFEIFLNIVGTIALSIVVSYFLVYLFQHLRMQVKLFLVIGVLLLLFAVGKFFHISSLLIILIFGIILNNTEVFFRGRFAKYFDRERVKPILHDFHNLTLESAFLVRTFFFVVFGITITVSSLYNWEVAVNSLAIVAVLYIVRYIALKIFAKDHIFPELWIAPRGLITVLLFFSLIKEDSIRLNAFDTGLLLYPILITSMIMMVALISYRGEKVTDVIFRKTNGTGGLSAEDFEKRSEENINSDFDGF